MLDIYALQEGFYDTIGIKEDLFGVHILVKKADDRFPMLGYIIAERFEAVDDLIIHIP